MIVKEQKEIEFINDCDCLVDYNELSKAIMWYQNKPTAKLKHIYIYQNYPTISIYDKKLHIHRLLMMYWNNNKSLDKEIYVHHIDGNKLNALRNNLTVMINIEHQRMHNIGKINTERQRLATINSNHKRKGIKKGIIKSNITYQKIWDLYQKGYSINKISKILCYDWGQVKIRINEIHDNPELLEVEND